MTYPRSFSHIGLSVPTWEKAVEFYAKVMEWFIVMQSAVVTEEKEPAIKMMCEEVFSSGFGSFKSSHRVTSDGMGEELFDFPNNEPAGKFIFWKTGLFHFCIQAPDVEDMVEKIVAHGWKQRMPIREYDSGEKPYRMCNVENSFGIIFEGYSHSYEVTYSKGAY